ncbi:hypothetical protein [Amycolatopsis solani]|uniref:hypothetical protein n=1 Tax=Amycolatopsis solani TaxID=3028615 RepID=UPI0025B16834|nr:hypothetical protein [Amycolatopsis sp. MEP2-6]
MTHNRWTAPWPARLSPAQRRFILAAAITGTIGSAVFLLLAVLTGRWTSWVWTVLFALSAVWHWYLYVNRRRRARQH